MAKYAAGEVKVHLTWDIAVASVSPWTPSFCEKIWPGNNVVKGLVNQLRILKICWNMLKSYPVLTSLGRCACPQHTEGKAAAKNDGDPKACGCRVGRLEGHADWSSTSDLNSDGLRCPVSTDPRSDPLKSQLGLCKAPCLSSLNFVCASLEV